MKFHQPREPLALHGLLNEEELHIAKCLSFETGRDEIDMPPDRKPLSVAAHATWRESLTTKPADELEELLEDIRRAEFEGKGARP